jgi:hypothetical protein
MHWECATYDIGSLDGVDPARGFTVILLVQGSPEPSSENASDNEVGPNDYSVEIKALVSNQKFLRRSLGRELHETLVPP